MMYSSLMRISQTHHSLDPNNVNGVKVHEMDSCPHLIMQDCKVTPPCHSSSQSVSGGTEVMSHSRSQTSPVSDVVNTNVAAVAPE